MTFDELFSKAILHAERSEQLLSPETTNDPEQPAPDILREKAAIEATLAEAYARLVSAAAVDVLMEHDQAEGGGYSGVRPRARVQVRAEPLRDLLLLVLSDRERAAVPGFDPEGDDGLLEYVTAWDAITRGEVAKWASAVHLRASDHVVKIPPQPAVIAALNEEAS